MTIMARLYWRAIWILVASFATPLAKHIRQPNEQTIHIGDNNVKLKFFMDSSSSEKIRSLHNIGRWLFKQSSRTQDIKIAVQGHKSILKEISDISNNILEKSSDEIFLKQMLISNAERYSEVVSIQKDEAKKAHTKTEINTKNPKAKLSLDTSGTDIINAIDGMSDDEADIYSFDTVELSEHTIPSYLNANSLETPPEPSPTVLTSKLHWMTCEHVKGYYDNPLLQMVTSCPPEWTDAQVRHRCEHRPHHRYNSYLNIDIGLLPTQCEHGVVYANTFCAQCHEAIIILPWTKDFSCEYGSKFSDRFSTLLTTGNMPLNSTMLNAEFCKARIHPANTTALKNCSHPVKNRRRGGHGGDADDTYPVSFDVLMNFDFSGNAHILFSAGEQLVRQEYITRCKPAETWDPLKDMCRETFCGRDRIMISGHCVYIGENGTQVDEQGFGQSDLQVYGQKAFVSLLLNITYNDYLFMKYYNRETQADLKKQIADHLNISESRIEAVNITYKSGALNGSNIEVHTLSQKMYDELFSLYPERFGNTQSTTDGQHSTTEAPATGAPPTNKFDKHYHGSSHVKGENGNVRQKWTTDNCGKNSGLTTEELEQLLVSRRFVVKRDLGKEKPGHITDIQADQYLDDENDLSMSGKDRIPKQSIGNKTHIKLSNLNSLDSFTLYDIETETETTSVYVSTPFNCKDERIIITPRCVRYVMDQPMVMNVSFILNSPEELTKEENNNDVISRISLLVDSNKFTMQLQNGNVVSVIEVKDRSRKVNKAINESDFCPLGKEIMVFDEEFQMFTVDNVTMLYVNKTHSYVGVGRFDAYLYINGSLNDNGTLVDENHKYAFICVMPRIAFHRDCRRIIVSVDEYNYTTGFNKSIMFEDNEYDIFRYKFIDTETKTISLCVPMAYQDPNKPRLSPEVVAINNACGNEFDSALIAEGYITYILGIVSIIALAGVLITYCLFAELRNLPGINTMNLTLCLFVAEVIFIFGMMQNEPAVCTAVAISMHYMFLASHFWMNVMSYDVYKTFANGTIMREVRKKQKYLRKYSLYAWGIPALIVGFCVFVDMTSFVGFKINYGVSASTRDNHTDFTLLNMTSSDVYFKHDDDETWSDGPLQDQDKKSNRTFFYYTDQTFYGQSAACWINNPSATLLAFGAPILLIFATNCVFFIKTIISITKTARLTKHDSGQRHSRNNSFKKMSGRNDVMLYVRMSTVMGFTWFFGLSSSFMSSFLSKPVTHTACIVSHVQSVLFSLLNISQGIFIFVAFVCNRRVLALYVRLIRTFKKQITKWSPKSRTFSLRSNITGSFGGSSNFTGSTNTGVSYITYSPDVKMPHEVERTLSSEVKGLPKVFSLTSISQNARVVRDDDHYRHNDNITCEDNGIPDEEPIQATI